MQWARENWPFFIAVGLVLASLGGGIWWRVWVGRSRLRKSRR